MPILNESVCPRSCLEYQSVNDKMIKLSLTQIQSFYRVNKMKYIQSFPKNIITGTTKCLLLLILATVINVTFTTVSNAKETLQVTVSILPQRYFVEKIAKDLVKVSVIVQPGSNPATYEPKPSQMTALTDSEIYFAIGVPFENAWLKKLSSINPKMLIIHTDASITKRKMIGIHHFNNEHKDTESAVGYNDSLKTAGLDPHIWLSPPLVKKQAQIIADTLIKTDPSRKEVYEQNLSQFQYDLDKLDSEIRAIFHGRVKRTDFLVFHPSWGYFAEAYGLKQIPVEIEGKEPGAKEMANLIKYAKKSGINAIFIQPQFPSKNAEVIAREINARVIIADPLSENWMKNLREIAKKFSSALN